MDKIKRYSSLKLGCDKQQQVDSVLPYLSRKSSQHVKKNWRRLKEMMKIFRHRPIIVVFFFRLSLVKANSYYRLHGS